MISASNTLKNLLKQNSSITIDSGCTIEYNMNDMVNNPTVKLKNISTGVELTENEIYKEINGHRPFKNVFPYSSVALSNRPAHAGIKYGILGDISATEIEVFQGAFVKVPDYTDPKNLKYQKSGLPLWFRTYYPGVKNEYKYFITQKNGGARMSVEYDKTVLTNKIVIKFEISHGIPQSGNIKIKTPGGSYVQQLTFTSSNISTSSSSNPGVMNIYYTGSAWSFNESALNTSSSVPVIGVELQVAALPPSAGNNYIGIIEISPRWVIDVSQDIISIDVAKESSMDQEITPVGLVSANSISISLNKYNNSDLKVLPYDKTETTFQSDKLYLYKDAEVKPFFKVYYTNAPLSDSKGAYEKVLQGSYYMDSWNVDEFGGAQITALDGAKKLQQTFCPDILCKEFSSTAIIRRLLDSVGFANYNINTATDNLEDGVIKPSYWWTESSKTVWQAIQELCKDNQMVATFDENNVLQFYTRNYLYDSSKAVDWPLTYDTSGSDLPNIASLNKKEFRNGNKLTVRWNSVESTEGSLDAAPLWSSPTSWLGALTLTEDISAEKIGYVGMDPISSISTVNQEMLYSLNGYLLIDSEIIEYDAIQYEYATVEKPTISDWQYRDITSASDIKKYMPQAFKPTYQYFRPSGKVRIKSRGAFNTVAVSHKASINNNLSDWAVQNVRWS